MSDLISVPVDIRRHWTSTEESTKHVPHWKEVQEDAEVQSAFREVGLAC